MFVLVKSTDVRDQYRAGRRLRDIEPVAALAADRDIRASRTCKPDLRTI
jgi:hypothetical protein